MLWSIGKDSTVLLWLARKAFFGHVPFPLVHVDTTYKIASMIEYRDQLVKEWKLQLVVGKNEAVLKSGVTYPNGKATRVDPATMTIETDFDKHQAAVANVVPPQKAGHIAELAGVADRTGWCPIDPVSFESTLKPNIHVIGDACLAGAMPKAGFAANAQAKVCAAAVARLLAGGSPDEPRLINTCYSILAPDYGITVAAIYKPANGRLVDVPNSGGTSPVNAPRTLREQEAKFADGWFRTITSEMFG